MHGVASEKRLMAKSVGTLKIQETWYRVCLRAEIARSFILESARGISTGKSFQYSTNAGEFRAEYAKVATANTKFLSERSKNKKDASFA